MKTFMRGSVMLAAILALPTTGALAGAAHRCHPDPPGTRTARVGGEVRQYVMRGNGVRIVYQARKCLRVPWVIGRPLGRARQMSSAACDSSASPASEQAAGSTAGARVALIRGSADTPDRVRVRSATGTTQSWPLPSGVTGLDAFGRFAVFSGEREAYAMRLSDGRVGLIGLNRYGDTPQIEAPGVVFQDNLDKAKESQRVTLMKFIPTAAVDNAVSKAGQPVGLPGRVEEMAMDGFRVAIGFHRTGECAQILYWNIAWDYVSKITDEDQITCGLTDKGGVIRSVAMAGIRSAWVIHSRHADRILTSNSTACFDRVLLTLKRKGGAVTSLSGDGNGLAYALRNDHGRISAVGAVQGRRVQPIAKGEGSPVGLSADGTRLAVLNAGGSVDLREKGTLVRTIQAPGAVAIALRASRLVVLTRNDRLQVFDTQTGTQVHDWSAPAGASHRVDAQFGVAVLTAGGNVYAVALETGRTAVLASAGTYVRAEIEAPGVAYAVNQGTRASLRFIPFAEVEAALR